MKVLVEWSRSFKQAHGQFPEKIEQIAQPDTSDANFLPRERWWSDGWKHRFRYARTGDSFELRSAGDDGKFYTQDDLVSGSAR
ncbi:MAG: hypothetical protein ABI765_12140 [Gemmatimonadota bacterium]